MPPSEVLLWGTPYLRPLLYRPMQRPPLLLALPISNATTSLFLAVVQSTHPHLVSVNVCPTSMIVPL